LLVLRVLTQCTYVGLLQWGELTKERPLRGSLGNLLYFSPFSSPFAWLQTLSDAGWSFSPSTGVKLQQLGVGSVFLFGASPMQVATTAQQTSRGLLAVGPDMDKVLQM
jgi:hypothetical protein